MLQCCRATSHAKRSVLSLSLLIGLRSRLNVSWILRARHRSPSTPSPYSTPIHIQRNALQLSALYKSSACGMDAQDGKRLSILIAVTKTTGRRCIQTNVRSNYRLRETAETKFLKTGQISLATVLTSLTGQCTTATTSAGMLLYTVEPCPRPLCVSTTSF